MGNSLNTMFLKIKKIFQPAQLPDEILKIVETVDSVRWTLEVDRSTRHTRYTYTDTVGGFVISSAEHWYDNDDGYDTYEYSYESSVSYLTHKETKRLYYLIHKKWWADYHAREKEKLKDSYATN